MKKLLLSSAICALAVISSPAFAQEDSALKLNVGGYFKGYAAYVNQDEDPGEEARGLDILRDTEVHFGGETTLDNGLTVGAQIEAAADNGDNFAVDESYVYFASAWGRVNFGNEDGAAYLLQVAAPSADDNYDGIRQFVYPTNYTVSELDGSRYATSVLADGLDYDNDLTTDNDKITYLSPVFNGFQAGVSYTPDVDGASTSFGNSLDDVLGAYGDAYEVAARYEGQFNAVGFILGAGYTHLNLERDNGAGTLDDSNEWNVGADFDIGAFGVGVAYTEAEDGSVANTSDTETFVVGADYTTGAFKLGASYLNRDQDETAGETEADRYTGGVVYTYGPGMTFRGSVSYVDEESTTAIGDNDSTSVLLGTQINF